MSPAKSEKPDGTSTPAGKLRGRGSRRIRAGGYMRIDEPIVPVSQ